MKYLSKVFILKFVILTNFFFSNLLLADNHNIYETLEQIKKDIKTLETFFQSIKKPGDDIETPNNDASPLGRAIKRASNYFLLGALLAIILSSLAIAICSLQFIRRHVDYVAVFKALGLAPSQIRNTYFLVFGLIALFSFLTGILIGWIVQISFTELLKDYFPSNLPLPGLEPYLISFVTAFLCLIGFAYPMLRNLFELSPNTILRLSLIHI